MQHSVSHISLSHTSVISGSQLHKCHLQNWIELRTQIFPCFNLISDSSVNCLWQIYNLAVVEYLQRNGLQSDSRWLSWSADSVSEIRSEQQVRYFSKHPVHIVSSVCHAMLQLLGCNNAYTVDIITTQEMLIGHVHIFHDSYTTCIQFFLSVRGTTNCLFSLTGSCVCLMCYVQSTSWLQWESHSAYFVNCMLESYISCLCWLFYQSFLCLQTDCWWIMFPVVVIKSQQLVTVESTLVLCSRASSWAVVFSSILLSLGIYSSRIYLWIDNCWHSNSYS